MRLSELKVKQSAVITKVARVENIETKLPDMVASRLETLGFVPGTRVQVITKGIFGGDPILIQVGFTRFALRKVEAEKLKLQMHQREHLHERSFTYCFGRKSELR